MELFIDGSGGNRHFHNLAHWFGREYYGEQVSNPIDVNMVKTMLTNIINKMDIDSY